jgi:hypothetical protein
MRMLDTLLGRSISFWSRHHHDNHDSAMLSNILVAVILAPIRRREELRKVLPELAQELPALFRFVLMSQYALRMRIRVDRVLVLESVLLAFYRPGV